ncbi:MAG: sodium:calcium antiporter [Candidatus Longimicrobiales bacterium M2_2A_002]
MIGVLLSLVGLAVGTGVTWWGSGKLEASSARLARRYRLPAVVQGTLVVAVGSSFPELSTTVLSTAIHGEFQLGMAAIVGSAIFNILVIPALAGLAGSEAEHSLRLVYRDAQFYLTSVAVLLLAFSFALIYHPVGGDAAELSGSMTRPIAMVPLLLYGVYLFLQQQDTAEHRGEGREPGRGPASRREAPVADGATGGDPGRDWLILVAGLVAILLGVEALVRAVLHLGDQFGIPSFLWGVTVVAAATSVPDALVSYRAARKGDSAVSLGNVLGSNIFDLLVAIPAGVLLAGATVIDYGVAAPLMGMLTLATIVLFAAMRTGVTLSHGEAWVFLGLYGVFIAWAVAESAGVVHLVGGH